MKISINNTASYSWGKNCQGWHLLNKESLSIIREKMPSGASEVIHFHKYSQQFFYILKGIASFEFNNSEIALQKGEGIYIPRGKKHRILNKTNNPIEFLVISQPHSHADKIEIE